MSETKEAARSCDMTVGSKIALIRDFHCEMQEHTGGYPIVEIHANIIIDKGNIMRIDIGIVKSALTSAVKSAAIYKPSPAEKKGGVE